jgi:hypothetical protein
MQRDDGYASYERHEPFGRRDGEHHSLYLQGWRQPYANGDETEQASALEKYPDPWIAHAYQHISRSFAQCQCGQHGAEHADYLLQVFVFGAK